MSIPDTLSYLNSKMNFPVRISELEFSNDLFYAAKFYWVDELTKNWLTVES